MLTPKQAKESENKEDRVLENHLVKKTMADLRSDIERAQKWST